MKLLASTADNVLPQVLPDAVALGINKKKCQTDRGYWIDNKAECKSNGWYYNSGNRRRSINEYKCHTNKSYWNDNKAECKSNGWYYNKAGNRRDSINDEPCKRWKKNNQEKYDDYCRNALSDFFENYKDAELIADILTGVYDDEDFKLEDFHDEDFKDDLEESQDE